MEEKLLFKCSIIQLGGNQRQVLGEKPHPNAVLCFWSYEFNVVARADELRMPTEFSSAPSLLLELTRFYLIVEGGLLGHLHVSVCMYFSTLLRGFISKLWFPISVLMMLPEHVSSLLLVK